MGLSKVFFESDALSIIQAINEGNVSGEFGHIIQIIEDLVSSFSWCTFQHLKRDGNRVAHDLAKEARINRFNRNSRSFPWEENKPLNRLGTAHKQPICQLFFKEKDINSHTLYKDQICPRVKSFDTFYSSSSSPKQEVIS
nr:hypothetical protein CFP56_22791 [Quercus suber]